MKVILHWIIVGLLVILFYSVLFFMLGCFVPAQDRGPAGFDAQGNVVEKPTYVIPKQRVKKKAVKYWPKYKITFYRGTSGLQVFVPRTNAAIIQTPTSCLTVG